MTEAHTLTEHQVDELLADPEIPAAHRAPWVLLRDGELRLADALALKVGDIEFTDGPGDQGGRADVEHPVRGDRPRTTPISKHTAELLRQAVDGRETGPALHTDGRPLSCEAASRTARAAGAGSIHAFRYWGKLHNTRPPRQ